MYGDKAPVVLSCRGTDDNSIIFGHAPLWKGAFPHPSGRSGAGEDDSCYAAPPLERKLVACWLGDLRRLPLFSPEQTQRKHKAPHAG